MKKYLIIHAICLAAFVFVASAVLAQTEANIQYPIAELGNCEDKTACFAYCDLPQNMQACVEFARKNGLMSPQELQEAEKFLALGGKGPGGCATKAACETYCDDTSHTAECIKFVVENELLSGQELEEAKMALAAIEKGATPPPCRGKKDCDVYCENPSHMEECITFGAQAGFIKGQELENAQKMLAAIKKGAVPPKCNGKEECDIYCQQEDHFKECADFAEAAGFMTSEEAVMARKTMGKGPGGCRGKEECDAFCNNPANQQTCFQFGVDNGLISQEDLQKMGEGKQMTQQSLAQAPAEVISCLEQALGSNTVQDLKSGAVMPSQSVGDQMRQCFEKMGPAMGPGMGPGMMPAGMTGPGGCNNPESCQQYCTTNPDECKNFAPPSGAMPGGQPGDGSNFAPGTTPSMAPGTMPGGQMMTGPGGCTSPESCQSYCQTNPTACQNFTPPQSGGAPLPNQQMMPPMPMEQGGTMGMEGQPGTAPGMMPGQQMYGASPDMPMNFDPNMPPMSPDSMQSAPPPAPDSGGAPPSSFIDRNPFLAALIAVFRYFFPF